MLGSTRDPISEWYAIRRDVSALFRSALLEPPSAGEIASCCDKGLYEASEIYETILRERDNGTYSQTGQGPASSAGSGETGGHHNGR